ncbi:MAG: hypothetical protein U0Y82_02600 [Thermoleophilia bacterium]
MTLAIALFVGIGAIDGGISLLVDAEGFGVRESWLHGSPFSDYTVPGLVLLVVIGGGCTALAALAVLGRRATRPAALAMGVILLCWLGVETLVIGFHGAWQLVLVGVIGLCALALIVLHRRPADG